MQEDMVCYDGRLVPKQGFRVFVYAKDGSQILVNSWEEYELALDSGQWFSHKDKVNLIISDDYIKEKTKGKRGRKKRVDHDDS